MTSVVITSYYYLGDRLVLLKDCTKLRFVHQDHLSGTAVITDTDGEEVGSIKYYPYGETRNTSGTLETDKKFTGQRLDDTGLYYYGARFYDPTIGRFISADTLVPSPMNPQAFNRYSYCLNNPLKYIDPSGLLTVTQLENSDVHRDDEGMTDKLWNILSMIPPGATFEWTNPEGTEFRRYRVISMDQDWQPHWSGYGYTAEIQGERVWYFGPINPEGYILHEVGTCNTMRIGELDSSNLRGVITYRHETYNWQYDPYNDTIYGTVTFEIFTWENPWESGWDKMQSGWGSTVKIAVGGLLVGATVVGDVIILRASPWSAPWIIPASAILIDAGVTLINQGSNELGWHWYWPFVPPVPPGL